MNDILTHSLRKRRPQFQDAYMAVAVRLAIATCGEMTDEGMIEASCAGLAEGLFGPAWEKATEEQRDEWIAMARREYRRATGKEMAKENPWEREPGVDEVLAIYGKRIKETPLLLSLLYDADMLPEQIVSMRGAISMAAVVEAYEAGCKEALRRCVAEDLI